eukprot:7978844-Pyramimonas_sp.AAC.1
MLLCTGVAVLRYATQCYVPRCVAMLRYAMRCYSVLRSELCAAGPAEAAEAFGGPGRIGGSLELSYFFLPNSIGEAPELLPTDTLSPSAPRRVQPASQPSLQEKPWQEKRHCGLDVLRTRGEGVKGDLAGEDGCRTEWEGGRGVEGK